MRTNKACFNTFQQGVKFVHLVLNRRVDIRTLNPDRTSRIVVGYWRKEVADFTHGLAYRRERVAPGSANRANFLPLVLRLLILSHAFCLLLFSHSWFGSNFSLLLSCL